MSRAGSADLPLHSGSAPRWLFERMEELAEAISEVIIREYGQEELLERISDPYWFQGFGCALGFDWHSSGLTTTTMGALKEALDIEEHGITVAGGKGETSRKTPEEIDQKGDFLSTKDLRDLKKASRMSASIDNSCVQDSFSLYHHTLVFTEKGGWSVVQQGMNQDYARRYHWSSDSFKEFVEEPQNAICSMERKDRVLDLTSRVSRETRQTSLDLVKDNPEHLRRYVSGQSSLTDFSSDKHLDMPSGHWLEKKDLSDRAIKQLKRAYEIQPENYEELVGLEGIGKKSLRALALIS